MHKNFCSVLVWKMEKENKRVILAPFFLMFLTVFLPFFYFSADFFHPNTYLIQINPRFYVSGLGTKGKSVNKTLEDQKFVKFHLAKLVRGDDRKMLESTGFACDNTTHSLVCVSTRPVTIHTPARNMTVYIPSDRSQETLVVRPYAKQESSLHSISPVRLLRQATTAASAPPCRHQHYSPALVFSSGSTGNAFHEMNEIIIPLFLTARHIGPTILLLLQDYNPSFIFKYRKILSALSAHDVLDPARSPGPHCFPGAIIGLRYHGNLALDPAQIPGGYSTIDFKRFLRQVYNLQYAHVSQMENDKPRLLLVSRTGTRRILNEDEVVQLMEEVGFRVAVVRRARAFSEMEKLSRVVNSCRVVVGVHGAGLTNEVFLAEGAAVVQIEPLGTEWASRNYYGDGVAQGMGVEYLRYKIGPNESSLSSVFGPGHRVVRDPDSVYKERGIEGGRRVYLYTQNIRLNLTRFRETLVEALSVVTVD